MPVQNGNGEWGLDFQGRSAAPSSVNSVIVEGAEKEPAFFVRWVDDREIDCDGKVTAPQLLLFLTILCLMICPF
jgi:hypothetical protein